MAAIKLEKVGAQVNWPVGEKIPKTLEGALDLGWEVKSGEGSGEYEEVGDVYLQKTVGMLSLSLSIPYRSTIKYGKPHTPKARIITQTRRFTFDNGRFAEMPSTSTGQGGVN
jgi:hypothetical protein